MKKILKLTSLIACLLVTGNCFAANISGVPLNQDFEISYSAAYPAGYSWDLGAKAAPGGDSDVMLGKLNCEEYTIDFIAVGATVVITAAVRVAVDGTNYHTTNTYTLTAAGAQGPYTWSGASAKAYVTYTITNGTISSTPVRCRTK